MGSKIFERRKALSQLCLAILLVSSSFNGVAAEPGVIHVYAQNSKNQPQRGLIFCVSGKSQDSQETGSNGKTIIKVPRSTKPGEQMVLVLTKYRSFGGKQPDWRIVEPTSGRTRVPPFDDSPSSVVEVTVTEAGNKQLLAEPAGLKAMGTAMVKSTKSGLSGPVSPQQLKQAKEQTATQYGVTVEQMDAIFKLAMSRTESPPECRAIAYMYNGDFAQAEQLLGQAAGQALYKSVNIDLLMAHAQYEQGKYSLAVATLSSALNKMPDDLDCLDLMAMTHAHLGEYTEAERIGRKALEIAEACLPANDESFPILLNDLAVVLIHQGKQQEADQLIKRAIAIQQRKSKGDIHMATLLGNRAATMSDQVQAEAGYKAALEMLEGSNDPHAREVTSAFLNNLADIYVSQGMFELAEPLYRRSLALDHDKSKLDEARDLNNLGKMYLEKHQPDQALPLLKQSLALRWSLSSNKRSLGYNLVNLAEAYRQLGQMEDARSAERQAYNVLKPCKEADPSLLEHLRNSVGNSDNRSESDSNDSTKAQFRVNTP